MRRLTLSASTLFLVGASLLAPTRGQQQPTPAASRKISPGVLTEVIENEVSPVGLALKNILEIGGLASITQSSRATDVDPLTLQRNILPLGLQLRVLAGAELPEVLRRHIAIPYRDDFDSATGTRLITLTSTSREVLEAAAASEAVLSIEIDRPPTLGPPVEITPFNLAARRSHFVDQFSTTYGVIGQGAVAAVFDGGAVLRTHTEFRMNLADPINTRVELGTAAKTDEHATHVAGTMAAFGRKPEAKGMAPGLKIISASYQDGDDMAKLDQLSSRVQVSNHSYGRLVGWSQQRIDNKDLWFWYGDRGQSKTEDSKFGKYTSWEARLDEVLYKNRNLVTVVAAGNDRTDKPKTQPIQHYVIDVCGNKACWKTSFESHQGDGDDRGGLDTISSYGIAKNAITVGSINDVVGPEPISMTTYSAWGPTDDGRIKPDLVANGQILLSCSDSDDLAYAEMSGTSMASPTAAGIAALMVEHFQRSRGAAPSSAVIKGVLIHTATNAGEKGPDPIYGWGAIHALRAGHVMARQGEHIIEEAEVGQDQSKEYLLNFVGNPLASQPDDPAARVTLVWTDPPAEENKGGLDDPTPTLMNDLDVKLIAPNGTVFHPYSLVAGNPLAPATRGAANRVDNVEVVDLFRSDLPPDQLAGQWRLVVTANSMRQGPTQRFALVVSGLSRP